MASSQGDRGQRPRWSRRRGARRRAGPAPRRTVSSSAGPPTSSAAASRSSAVDPVQVGPGPAQHLGRGQLGVQRVPEPGLPQRGGPAAGRARRRRVASRSRSQPANSSSAATAAAAAGSDRGRPARAPGPAAAAARRGSARRCRRTGRPPSPGGSAGSRAASARAVASASGIGRQPAGQAGQPLLGRRVRPGDQRVQQRRPGCAPAGSTRARGPRSARTAPGRPGAEHGVVDLLLGVELVGVDLGSASGGVAQHRHVARRPPSAERSGSRSSNRWSPADAASPGRLPAARR